MKNQLFLLPRYLFATGLIALLSLSLRAQNGWSQFPSMPQPAGFMAGQELDGKFYFAGGLNAQLTATAQFLEFDPANAVWDTLPALPQPKTGAGMVAVAGQLYVLGGLSDLGGTTLSTLHVYDPQTGVWTQRNSMPTARAYFGAVALDGKIYAIGGGTSSASAGLTSVEIYDPATDTWTAGPALPAPRGGLACAVVESKIYVFGGAADGALPATASVWVLDPGTGSWTPGADMPTPRLLHATAMVNGQIYALGGSTWGSPGSKKTVLERYDPATDGWQTLPSMPTPRHALVLLPFLDKLYAFGGIEDHAGLPTASDKIEVYNTATSPTFEPQAGVSLAVWPNPAVAGERLTLLLPEAGLVRADLYSPSGVLLESIVLKDGLAGNVELPFKTGALPKGVYLIRLTLNNAPLGSTTLVVQ